jgi:hypothetical protein
MFYILLRFCKTYAFKKHKKLECVFYSGHTEFRGKCGVYVFIFPDFPRDSKTSPRWTATIKGCTFPKHCSLPVDKFFSKHTHAIDTHTTESSKINSKERREINQRFYTEDMKQITAAKHCGNSQKNTLHMYIYSFHSCVTSVLLELSVDASMFPRPSCSPVNCTILPEKQYDSGLFVSFGTGLCIYEWQAESNLWIVHVSFMITIVKYSYHIFS